MLEKDFQKGLINELKKLFPDAMIFKNDAKQGYPDILILNGDKWASLECKQYEDAPHRPNQDYYVEKMNRMSFAAFVYPENKKYVIDNLKNYFDLERV